MNNIEMKQYLYVNSLVLLFSCAGSNNIPPPPTEKCENISLDNLPVITHGFYSDTYDSVIVETFVKNSKFDTLLKKYVLKLSSIRDKERVERDFSLPKEITTGTDIKISLNDSLIYKITEIQTAWVPRWCQSFCGYECTMTSFKINDSIDNDGGNIFIEEPNIKYPWGKQ
jgi:hypothetical protein